MQRNLICAMTFLLLGTATLLNSCKKHDKEEPLVINPTVSPIPYSVMVYLITPSDKTFNPDYYRAARTSILSVQNWYKAQLSNKTFTLNPVVVDTFTSVHNSSWFASFNGDSISGTGNTYSYYNTYYELQQRLSDKFDTTHFTYFAFVVSDFADETKPKGVAAEGVSNLAGLSGQFPGSWTGADAHALAHAFGLPEPATESSNGVMSLGWPNYPNCVFTQEEKDYLNASPFLKAQ